MDMEGHLANYRDEEIRHNLHLVVSASYIMESQ